MAMAESIERILPDVTAWRRHLHQHPELQFDLPETAAFVAEKLRGFGCDSVTTGIGRTGVVATIKGKKGGSSRAIGLRADMDALPIHEQTNLPYRSTVAGKMHACGHDGHTSMLLGAAKYLAETRDFDGTVVLIFQPAEEGGAGGAPAMIADGLFERFPVDEVYGMHNWPGLALGEYAIRPGPILGAFDDFRIDVEGLGGHASTPDKAVDTVVVLAHIVTALQTIVSRNTDPRHAVVISTTTIHAGDANNIIPQSGSLTGSVRTLLKEDQALCEKRMREVCELVAASFGAKATLTYKHLLPATMNEESCTQHMITAAAGLVGRAKVDTGIAPQLGSEDFAFMTQVKPGAYILVGNGDSAELHHPAYNFNDDAAKYGVTLWAKLIEERLATPAG